MKRCPLCKTTFPDEANFCPLDAGRLVVEVAGDAPVESPTIQAKLLAGRFHLGPSIGGNRTGEVFASEDAVTGQQCAVKTIAAAVLPTPLIMQRTERELKQLHKVLSERVVKVV